jgi:hypothetical protein
MSRRSLLTAAAALSISLSASAVAHAQGGTITLPTSCAPIPDQGVVNTGGAFVAGTGLIQNFGSAPLVVNCSMSRAAVGRNVNGTVTLDGVTQAQGNLSAPVLTARLMAVATPPGGPMTIMFVNIGFVSGVQGLQRITSAQFPMPLNDDFGVFLRVVLQPFDFIGRILYRQI